VAGDVLEEGGITSQVQIGRVEVDPAVLAGSGQPLRSFDGGRVAGGGSRRRVRVRGAG
jgi:hypothetical protein